MSFAISVVFYFESYISRGV